MINNCLDYESHILEGARKLQTSTQLKATLGFFHLLKHSYYMVPLAVLGLILFEPCTPPFILSMTTSCSQIRWNWRYMLIPLLETYIGFCFFYIGTAPLAYNFCGGISSLLSYIQLLDTKILKAKSTAEKESCLLNYRMIQLLDKMMNAFLMEKIVPSIICGAPLLQIGVQYVVITMHGEIAMPIFLIFPVILVDTILNNILIFTLASWVFNSSVKSIQKLDRTTVKYSRRSKDTTGNTESLPESDHVHDFDKGREKEHSPLVQAMHSDWLPAFRIRQSQHGYD
ncbi:hypothetical protein Fcan01_23271 [Folsomia candida]|uniref:Uncharacterized protein n=1 Tax=Folsomia candida TaxID=158441 RepID=A0A226D9F1_FOLCA|nr:hypothetical protein Fcan01_23271 [Folsomia candida]